MLSVKNLTVGFNVGTASEKMVLKNFNLDVEDGEFVVLLGSNGAGKSTLFNAILGSLAYKGDVILDEKNINRLPQHKRAKMIGVVFQDPLRGTAPNLSVFDNMLIASKRIVNFYARKKFKEEVKRELEAYGLGLENQLSTNANQLSGGQRQCLTLFMATNSNPRVLLLDEHTAALDPNTQEKVMEITDKIVSDKKTTTLMITHNLKTALKYGTRLIILNEGKIVVDLKGEDKKNATEEELLKLYSKHFSDNILFAE